eukprot:6725326-Pyramimonas_sp.AAC.1
MRDLHHAAREGPLPPIEQATIEGVVARLPSSKARGVDVLSPTDLQRLPSEGRAGFVSVLNAAEAAGTWPLQI